MQSHWFGGTGGVPIKPETDRLSSADTLCLYGEDGDESPCPIIGPRHARVLNLSGGHHFGGDCRKLADLILAQAGALGPVPAPTSRPATPVPAR